MHKYKGQYICVYVGACLFFVVSFWIAKLLRDNRMNAALAKNPQSHWKLVKDMSPGQQWLNVSYYVSILHALMLTFGCMIASA